jgi:hypothetical protein
MKMKDYFLIILLISAVIGFSSCKKYRTGCYEEKVVELPTQVNGWNINQGSTTHRCYYVGGDISGPYGEPITETVDRTTTTKVYYDDETCNSLGYKKRDGAGIYYSNDGPGEHGYWGSDIPDPDDPNTPAFCTGYVSPCTDPQVNPFCETAYNAQCILGVPATDVRVTEPCSTYAGYQQMNPAIANCDYCN